MPNPPYSPIDEPSFDDTPFDPAQLLNHGPIGGPVDSSPVNPPTPEPQETAQRPRRPRQPQSAPRSAARKPARRSLWRVLFDSRSAMFLGLILVVLAGYSLIVSISYFSHIGTDQSFLLNGDAANNPELIKNAGGPFGAWLAHTLIYNWLGIGSFILIYYFGAVGLSLLRVVKVKFWNLTMRSLLSAVSLSVVLGFITYNAASPFYWGGRHGLMLNDRLMTLGGFWAALGVTVIMAGMVFFLYLTELKSGLDILRTNYANYRERQETRRAERQQAEAEEAAKREAERAAKLQAEEELRRQKQAEQAARHAEREARAAERAAAQASTSPASASSQVESTSQPTQTSQADVASQTSEATSPLSPAQASTTEITLEPQQPVRETPREASRAYTDSNSHVAETAISDIASGIATAATAAATTAANTAAATAGASTPTPGTEPLFSSPSHPHRASNASDSQTDTTPSASYSYQADEEDASDSPTEAPLFGAHPHVDQPFDVEADTPDAETDSTTAGAGSLFPSAKPERRTAAEAVNQQPLYDPRADLYNYKFPTIDLLREINTDGSCVDTEEMEENKTRIRSVLGNYGIEIKQIDATVGPTVTLYEIIPAEGVRIAKIKRLEDDIALNLAALGIRIIAPIPGKGTIGIEVPNKDPQIVSMRSILESDTFANSRHDLPMALGRTISNEVFMADLCKMPHLLVAGATGMGKSVGLNAIIASLLYKKHPSELKFVLIDPKMVEFSLYAKLEHHYLAKLPDEEDAVITDPSKVVATLNSLCLEMDNRYLLLKDASMRTVKEYNERFCRHELNPEKGHRYMPYIVVVVDEFADLIMTAGKEVETPIARIAQKARAVGIHMILATQRPSTNVITGLIKANFPGRIAFRVFQMVDSRTILDRPGANQLIGRGDMLFSDNGRMVRVQCAFIDTPEVNAICDHIDRQIGYPSAYELPEFIPEASDGGGGMGSLDDRDPLFDECARLVVTTDTASTSSLQRRYSIGYNRAGKIMDQMEAAGIVGPASGGKPRQVLVDPLTLERILEQRP